MSNINIDVFFWSLDEVRDMIKGYMEEQGNPVVEFGPECKFLAFGYVVNMIWCIQFCKENYFVKLND